MTGSEIAIVGMAARLPGARSLAEYWRNLRDGVESIEFLKDPVESPDLLNDPLYVRAHSSLAGLDQFDAEFFGFSPQDAAIMDPQHRILLETAWEAMEHSGYSPDAFRGNIGVWATSGMNSYMMHNLVHNRRIMETVGEWLVRHTGNDMNFLATRISYEMNLRGPSVNVQTACSSALVAVHLASQSLLLGECDMALAGGSTINTLHRRGYLYKPGEILSPDGHCRPFDAQSAGTVFGNGAGMVVLRRLADALADGDHISAVLLGSAINNDGSMKVGYLAPSVEGQSKAVAEALAASGVSPETISYIEAHGTGTHVGDPIEVAALIQAYAPHTRKRSFCALGSVKSNIGHLGEAAAAAGFIKTVLALENRQLPPTIHYQSPNPQIDFATSPFYVNATLKDWKSNSPRRAGVTALGAGGTNCHVILEEAPAPSRSSQSRAHQLLTISAKSPEALNAAAANLAAHLRENPQTNLADTAFTLNVGRKPFDYRRTVVASTPQEAAAALDQASRVTKASSPSVAFLFPGQGSQYVGMGAELYSNEPVFRETVDQCARILKPELNLDLRDLLYGAGDRETAAHTLKQTSMAQPAIFTIEYAMAKLWMSWGVKPAAILGHSVGDYTAACLAGVFSLDDALRLVAARGRLMQQMPAGSMLVVPLTAGETEHLMNGDIALGRLCLAAVNAPAMTVVAGAHDAVDGFERKLVKRGVACQKLHTSHAFHSSMMDPVLEPFRNCVGRAILHPPTIPFISSMTGTWIRPDEATDPDYWVRQLRQPVRFAEGTAELLKNPSQVLIEAGPGHALTSLVRQQPTKPSAIIPSLPRPGQQDDLAHMLQACGDAWSAGVTVDWTAFWSSQTRHRVPLPTYPFQRKSYWIEPDAPAPQAIVKPKAADLAKKSDIADWFYIPSWRLSPLTPETKPHKTWLVFSDETGLGDSIVEKLRTQRTASPMRLTLTGEIESLEWTPLEPTDAHRDPGPGEVAIAVRASAMNFADVLKATGAFAEAPFGMECSGVIAAVGRSVTNWKIGDEVVAIGPESHATRVIRDARFVAPKPSKSTFEEAAALPAAYMTAWHALNDVAQLQPGERILIHAAAGGVGLAAVEIARKRGAEIFATAGSDEKRAYLKSLGIQHVFHSRTLDFASQVMEATNDEGIDVVLNSLTGEFIQSSLALLRAGGRFLEIGKKEILTAAEIPQEIAYTAIDLVHTLRENPEAYGVLLRTVIEQVNQNQLTPLPFRTFPMGEAAAAFEHMLQTRHIGKVVLKLDGLPTDVIRVRTGKTFAQLSANEFAIQPARELDYQRLLETLGRRAEKIGGILHLSSVTGKETNHLDRGFSSLMGLAKAIGRQELLQPIDLIVIANRLHDLAGETEVEPSKATLLGPARVIPRELANVCCRTIDIALPADWEKPRLIDQLAQECQSSTDDRTVAYRGAQRWVEIQQASPIPASTHQLCEKGVYLITGGLGGIALELAKHLAKTYQARIALVARTLHHDKTEAIRDCEKHGAEILVLQADVTDPQQMRAAVRQAHKHFGAIHGVFHTAGVLDDGLIQVKDPNTAASVLAPKVQGTLALADSLKDTNPDFVALFSSVSSVLGLEGQADYTAANAFLDAFAHHQSRRGPTRVVSVNWGAWKEAGLAVAASAKRHGATRTNHPWLDHRTTNQDETTFTTTFSRAKHWLLDEHVVHNADAVLPGTGYIELIRAAAAEIHGVTPIQIQQVFFQAPFLVAASESRTLEIVLKQSGDFTIYSDSRRRTHATGKVTVNNAQRPASRTPEITTVREDVFNGHLHQTQMDFGPRWANVQKIQYSDREALVSLQLPEPFATDLDHLALHPALLDMATGAAQRLVPGFKPTLYVPFSYGSLKLYSSLPATLTSHVRLKEGSGESLAVFDITLLAESGDVVAEIENFVMRPAGDAFHKPAVGQVPDLPMRGSADSALDNGILTREGMDALERILANPTGPQVFVSPIDLHEWLRQTDAAVKPPERKRRAITTGSGVEARLTDIWKNLLGVDFIAPNADFFDLGGHSLLMVRLATRLEKEFHKEVPLSFLFQNATIEKIAAYINEGRDSKTGKPQFFVPFNENGTGPAFFCVHSMGGDAIYRSLAKYLSPDQRFYGIQIPPELRDFEFTSSVERMAARYIEELLEFQPEGPYLLGGRSAGASVALEMAQQLRAKGHRVDLVVSFDGAPLTSCRVTNRRSPRYAFKLLRNLRYWITDDLADNFTIGKFTKRVQRTLSRFSSKGQRTEQEQVARYIGCGEFSERAVALMENFYLAIMRYVAKPYDSPVLLFRARTEPVFDLMEVDLAWQNIATNLETVTVRGHHQTLMDDRHVPQVAKVLDARLTECRLRAESPLRSPVSQVAS